MQSLQSMKTKYAIFKDNVNIKIYTEIKKRHEERTYDP
jgi:hypothetical protein